ncbi:MAG: spermine synthase, partial [Candidatus Omnitrophica bacterium]|nr:spermine synthase [Candidatus Omnitrophota bacterium]
MKMKKVLRLAILTTGFSGFFVQMLLLREFLIIFTGNELSIGIILTSWLISEGIGSYLSGKKSKNFISNEENFSILTNIFTIYFSFSIYLIRILRNILDISINQPVGVFQILYSSFLILFLPAFIHGALFTLSCKIYSNILDEKRKSAGYAYIYETTGTILGGVIWTFLLSINRLHSFYISFLISSLNFFTSFLVAIFLFNKDKIKIKIIKIFSIFLFLLNNYLIFTNYPEKIHKISLLKQWKGLNIINYQNSIYGNICLIENQQQYSFFLNGRHLSTIPIPDIEYIRKFVHLPLLLHPKPEKVLIISGNFEMINEVLKYETIK